MCHRTFVIWTSPFSTLVGALLALCHIRTLVGRRINNGALLAFSFLRGPGACSGLRSGACPVIACRTVRVRVSPFSTLVGALLALCHIRTLVGRRINNSELLASVLLCPVVGRSRPAVIACRTVRSGVFHHWIHYLWPQGAVPPGFNPLRTGWVYRPAPEAPRKGECRRGPRHFWNCPSRWASALRRDPP